MPDLSYRIQNPTNIVFHLIYFIIFNFVSRSRRPSKFLTGAAVETYRPTLAEKVKGKPTHLSLLAVVGNASWCFWVFSVKMAAATEVGAVAASTSDSYKGMSSDNIKGLVLALSSSLFIGASFIVKKKGLKKAGASGVRAGVGGYSYLYEPLWWIGMITMIVGEIANFAAYAFAPAILVTPLGALSIIISAVLAHIILREKLHIFGILGCALCVVGSTTIVLHAPQERAIESVREVWELATEPGFLFYAALVIAIVLILIFHYIPQYGQTHILFYIGVCSLVGSLSVMSVEALGIALKLTLSGINQLVYPQTWAFAMVVIICVLTQLNYLNKALDTFNTAVVSPIYYVMFTSLTILASVIMFKDWDRQNPTQIVTEMCGFVTILSGTFLLHKTKDMAGDGSSMSMGARVAPKHGDEEDGEGIPLRRQESLRTP